MDEVMVETSRIRTHCFVGGPEDGEPVLLIHGNITTGPAGPTAAGSCSSTPSTTPRSWPA